jgi:YVTN family beta-propeller protein
LPITSFAKANLAYITNQGADTVSVINTADNTVTATVSVGNMPFAFGNFLTSTVAGSCTGLSKTFTITVNPTLRAGAASTTPGPTGATGATGATGPAADVLHPFLFGTI